VGERRNKKVKIVIVLHNVNKKDKKSTTDLQYKT